MKKIQVSYYFEVHKFIEIYVDELVDYLDEETELEDVVEKYIQDYNNNCLDIDSSDELDEETSYLDITDTIEETEDDYEYLDEQFTIEDLIELKNSKV